MSLLNRAQTKKFILASVKAKRPSWKCTRVSAEMFEDLEAFLPGLLRAMVREAPPADGPCPTQADLLVKAVVKRRLLELFAAQHPWFICQKVADAAIAYIEHRLERRILTMVDRHPSGCGATFKPT